MRQKNLKTDDDDKRLDPDARFLLANERTFLAWVRTSLAVLVGGIALAQLGQNSTEKNVVGMAVIVLGGFMALIGYLRFRAADKAIRESRLPVTGREPLIQAGGIAAVALALVVTHLLGIW
jgi:putative membrane protein